MLQESGAHVMQMHLLNKEESICEQFCVSLEVELDEPQKQWSHKLSWVTEGDKNIISLLAEFFFILKLKFFCFSVCGDPLQQGSSQK